MYKCLDQTLSIVFQLPLYKEARVGVSFADCTIG